MEGFNLNIKTNFFIDIFRFYFNIPNNNHHSFFFKINLLISIIIFSLGILLFFRKKKFTYLNYIKLKIFLFYNIILLLPIFLSQKYHEDFGYYHLPYALSFIEEKIIFGFANIDNLMLIILSG